MQYSAPPCSGCGDDAPKTSGLPNVSGRASLMRGDFWGWILLLIFCLQAVIPAGLEDEEPLSIPESSLHGCDMWRLLSKLTGQKNRCPHQNLTDQESSIPRILPAGWPSSFPGCSSFLSRPAAVAGGCLSDLGPSHLHCMAKPTRRP